MNSEPQLIATCVSLLFGGLVLIAFFDCWGAIRKIRKEVTALRELAEVREKQRALAAQPPSLGDGPQ